MVPARRLSRILVTGVMTVSLLAPALPAYADRGPVQHEVKIGTVSLKGKTEAQVRSELAKLPKPAMTKVVIKGAGQEHVVAAGTAAGALRIDETRTLDRIYSQTATATVKPTWTVDKTKPAAWTAAYTKKVRSKPVNAKHVVNGKKRRLGVKAEKNGYKVDQAATSAKVAQRVLAEANDGKAWVVGSVYTTKKPKVTRKNLGKAILVVLKERRVYLYKNTKVEKKYRCAIGTRSYPTPTGNFKIVQKRYRPTWVNPAPNGWGSNMPSSIGPGARNPLGLRALNLNVSGIRIHGTSKISSIGTAASHGCVRLTNKNVIDLYKRVKVGTPVYIIK